MIIFLYYKIGNQKKGKTYDFQNFKTTWSFEREVHDNNLSLEDKLEEQLRLKDDFDIFKESTKPNFKNAIILLNKKWKVFNAFENVIFLKGKHRQGKGLPSSFTCAAVQNIYS